MPADQKGHPNRRAGDRPRLSEQGEDTCADHRANAEEDRPAQGHGFLFSCISSFTRIFCHHVSSWFHLWCALLERAHHKVRIKWLSLIRQPKKLFILGGFLRLVFAAASRYLASSNSAAARASMASATAASSMNSAIARVRTTSAAMAVLMASASSRVASVSRMATPARSERLRWCAQLRQWPAVLRRPSPVLPG